MNKTFPLAPSVMAATLACAVALVLGPAASAGAAPAQDDPAVLTIEAAHPADGGVHFIVHLTQGGDAVDGATVTATPATADGDQLAPVTLEPGDDGTYQGFVSFPSAGSWTVRIASEDPAVAVTQNVDVAVTPSTEGPPSGSNGGGFAPADDGTGSSTQSDDSGGPPVGLIIALAVVLVGGGLAAFFATRRARGNAKPAPPTPRAPQRKQAATAKAAKTKAPATAAPDAEPAPEGEADVEPAPEGETAAAAAPTPEGETTHGVEEGGGKVEAT
jgi:hypothetical protein